jgi:hypothetical protein
MEDTGNPAYPWKICALRCIIDLHILGTLEGLSAITLLELRISGFPALAEEVPECGIEVPVGGLQGLRVHISQEREDFFKLHEKLVALIIVRSLLPSPVCFRPEIQKMVIEVIAKIEKRLQDCITMHEGEGQAGLVSCKPGRCLGKTVNN